MADLQIILVPLLTVLTVGGIAYALFAPSLNGESDQKKRREKVVSATDNRVQLAAGKAKGDRRKQVTEALQTLEEQSKKRKKVSFKAKLKQAGFKGDMRKFWLISMAAGIGAGFFTFVMSQNPAVAGAVFIAAGLGLPRWVVGFIAKKRQRTFLEELPNAIDVIVRGIKSGLPLADCFRVIAREAKEPLRSEFRDAVDAQMLGQSLGDSLEKMYERIPLAEVNFLAIVITIQQSTGGNLAEALANLSKVIRGRKMMREKINAVSQEAKASAAIIGALPLVVATGLFVISPDYVGLMITTEIGNIMLAGCAVWMLIGVFIMAKMINFEI